jgi:uncharacterized coiled-coil DUF342 family protein
MNVHDYMRRLGDLLAVTENIIKERDEARREACEAANEIERLRAERDEARREVCELQANEVNRLSSAIRLKGWICFKETP